MRSLRVKKRPENSKKSGNKWRELANSPRSIWTKLWANLKRKKLTIGVWKENMKANKSKTSSWRSSTEQSEHNWLKLKRNCHPWDEKDYQDGWRLKITTCTIKIRIWKNESEFFKQFKQGDKMEIYFLIDTKSHITLYFFIIPNYSINLRWSDTPHNA